MIDLQKKVLIIPSWYPSEKNPIVGSFFKEQAELLMNGGFDVKVLYGINNFGNKRDLPLSFRGLKSAVTRQFLRTVGPRRAPSPPVVLKENVLLQGPPAYSFDINIPLDLNDEERIHLVCQAFYFALETLVLKNWKPDIIHAQSTFEAGIFASYLSEKFNIPFLIIEHQVFLLNNFSSAKQQMIFHALKNARRVGVVSEYQKRCVLLHEPDCNPDVIWNLINEDHFRIIPHKNNQQFTIVTVTYPAPIKDYQTFFKAMKLLAEDEVDFKYIIIGNSSFGDIAYANCDEFIRYSKVLEIDHLGTFIPSLTRNEIAEVVGSADLFISTSIAETFGIAAREAMLCGVPVVTTSCGGIEDSITADTGLTVPIRNYLAVAEAAVFVKNNIQKYDPITIREHVVKQCGKASFLKRMQEFYMDC